MFSAAYLFAFGKWSVALGHIHDLSAVSEIAGAAKGGRS